MAQHKLFSQHQYGFKSGRSCNSQLLDAMNDWTFAVNNNQDVDIILLDFAKAFDSVSHCRLLSKLKSYGIIGNTLTWIKAFLTDRKQFVQVKNSSSNLSDVLSGVPQGSVLGPTLFLIFINDLPENVKCKVKIFADDTKIYTSVKSDEDISKLQEDLNSLHVWSTTWGLKFNASKCTHVHVGNKFQTNTYYMKDDDGSKTNIKHSTAERDLGVIINDHLSPENHVNEIVAKAYRTIGCIKHSFTFMNKELFIILYKSLVRPILEYNSPVWSPSLVKHIQKIEKVQRHATKIIPALQNLSYSQRLQALGLPTLIYRRDRQDMIQVYQILSDTVNPLTHLFVTDENSRLRGHSKRL